MKFNRILLDPDPLSGASGGSAGGGSFDWKKVLVDNVQADVRSSQDAPDGGQPPPIPATPPPIPSTEQAQPAGGPADNNKGPSAVGTSQTTTPPDQRPAPIALDQETLAQIMGQAMTQAQQAAAQQQQQPVYTEEDYRKMFNVYRVGADHLKAMGFPDPTDEQITAFNEVLQGLSRQSVTVAAYQLAMEQQRLQQQYAPVQQFVQAQQLEAQKQRFFEKHPDLKGLDLLLLKVKDSFVKEGRRYKNEEEAFQAVANEARQIVKQTRDAAGVAGTQPNPTKQMTTLSGGGQGGAGDTRSSGGERPNWVKALS